MHSTSPRALEALEDFEFFSNYILSHTVNLLSEEESEARLSITLEFLERFPVDDIGLELVVFPGKLSSKHSDIQAARISRIARILESRFGTRLHAFMHFPTTPDCRLFLGSDDDAVTRRVLEMLDGCLDLARATGVESMVIHAGGNVDRSKWQEIGAREPGYKERVLENISRTLREMLSILDKKDMEGTSLALENMPWPFDIDAFTFTNVITSDFIKILEHLEEMQPPGLDRLGVCVDICHSWISKQSALWIKEMEDKWVPPGIFPWERDEFLKLEQMDDFVTRVKERVSHVHLSDSSGQMSGMPARYTQPTEGQEWGTGDLSRSSEVIGCIRELAATRDFKIPCTMEIKDQDFKRPVKTGRSLIAMGKQFYKE